MGGEQRRDVVGLLVPYFPVEAALAPRAPYRIPQRESAAQDEIVAVRERIGHRFAVDAVKYLPETVLRVSVIAAHLKGFFSRQRTEYQRL